MKKRGPGSSANPGPFFCEREVLDEKVCDLNKTAGTKKL
jgi:hypothetical protein